MSPAFRRQVLTTKQRRLKAGLQTISEEGRGVMEEVEVSEMLPSGYDNVFFTSTPPHEVLPEVLKFLVEKWSSMTGFVLPSNKDF